MTVSLLSLMKVEYESRTVRVLCVCGVCGCLRSTQSVSYLQGTRWRRTGLLVFRLAGAQLRALQPDEEGGVMMGRKKGGARQRERMVNGALYCYVSTTQMAIKSL